MAHMIASLPNDKFLVWTKFKSFAEDKLNIAKMMISVSDREENIEGKRENTAYQHLLLFPQSFQNASFFKVVNSRHSGRIKLYKRSVLR